MTLWYLGTQVDFRTLGALFGTGKSSVCSIVHEEETSAILPKAVFFSFVRTFGAFFFLFSFVRKYGAFFFLFSFSGHYSSF
jgi:hypothetical protein